MNLFKDFFIGSFGAIIGIILAYILIGIVFGSIFFIGYLIVLNNNKPNTKLFREMNTKQYFGIVLMLIGMSPFIQYFFQGLLFNAGSEMFGYFSDQF